MRPSRQNSRSSAPSSTGNVHERFVPSLTDSDGFLTGPVTRSSRKALSPGRTSTGTLPSKPSSGAYLTGISAS